MSKAAIQELFISHPYHHLIKTEEIRRDWIDEVLFPKISQLRDSTSKILPAKSKSLYCLFYEPSFLTRTSFERAMTILGGDVHHTEDASQFFPVKSVAHVDNVVEILASLHMDIVVIRHSDSTVIDMAASVDALPIINGGTEGDHPTQALADIYTMQRELGGIDGLSIAVVGRLEHRNVNSLLRLLSLYKNIRVMLVPLSGQIDPEVMAYCEERDMSLEIFENIESALDVDAIYLNAPRTAAHINLLKSRNSFNLKINSKFMSSLRPHCIVLDPMQRSEDFEISVQDNRLAFYRQAENALYVRMGVVLNLLEA